MTPHAVDVAARHTPRSACALRSDEGT
jgi:hypothetical protein